MVRLGIFLHKVPRNSTRPERQCGIPSSNMKANCSKDVPSYCGLYAKSPLCPLQLCSSVLASIGCLSGDINVGVRMVPDKMREYI